MYQTDQIAIENDGSAIETVLEEAERFAAYQNYSRKDTRHIRLLTEETLEMVRAMIGDHQALFWIEGNSRDCLIHLKAETKMDTHKRDILLDASKSKKNEAAKGIMGKIRDLFEVAVENYEDVQRYQIENGMGLTYTPYSVGGDVNSSSNEATMLWALSDYRTQVSQEREQHEEEWEAWDELEKSIVANIADDVRVSIRREYVEMVIEKKIGK